MAKTPHRELGARIKVARLRRGFTLAQMAAFCGATELAVRNWESGQSRPAADRLVKIADGLGVSRSLLDLGGPKWDQHVLQVTKLASPEVFAWPTQFPAELFAGADAGVALVFREPPGPDPIPVNEPSTPAKPIVGKREPKPTKASARKARGELFDKNRRRRTKDEFMPMIERGECCSLCLTETNQGAWQYQKFYCHECVAAFR